MHVQYPPPPRPPSKEYTQYLKESGSTRFLSKILQQFEEFWISHEYALRDKSAYKNGRGLLY